MKKNVFLIILISLLAIIGIIVGFLQYNKEESVEKEITLVNDIEEFISEYESYNGEQINDNDILEVDLNEDAIVYITSAEDIIDIMLEEDALIYFGFSTCPWCRNMIDVLLDAAENKDQAIYYVDIKSIRNIYSVEEGLIVESTVGEDAYYDILEIFGDYLSDYIVYDEDGVEYNTNTTRLYGPTLITVKEGELLDIYVGTHEEVTDPYTALTDEQYDELYTEFNNMINDLQNLSCGLDNC